MRIKEKYVSIRKTRDIINVKPTKLMVLCFLFEFCNRWVIQAIDSRYGYYMKDLYGFTSTMYSTLACIQSIWNCFQQGFLYGQITGKLKVPIPYLALFGVSLECIAYFLMGWAPNVVVTILGSFLLWTGYGCASPASMSIISTTNAPEVQGKVLSWNNMCQQVSLILSPLALSAIYAQNKHATYFSSILVSFIAIPTLVRTFGSLIHISRILMPCFSHSFTTRIQSSRLWRSIHSEPKPISLTIRPVLPSLL